MSVNRVVVNASPIICLCKSGLENLIVGLFDEIVIPKPVVEEILSGKEIESSFKTLISSSHVKSKEDVIVDLRVAAWDLGNGENSVISFALSHPEYCAILDDREARRCAMSFGCKFMGTIGVIILAKKKGIVPSIREPLQRLQNAGLWMSENFIKEILRTNKEEK
jgi:predicted nucleic acid-binding protein